MLSSRVRGAARGESLSPCASAAEWAPPAFSMSGPEAIMDDHYIATEREGPVLVITMDRPKVNAINHAMSRALYATLRELQETPELMVGILCSSNERVFS